ncbi:amidohydrolase family protein, partial [Leucobacter sp. M11]|uniref:amidohydrolase family protein n=1 Tax=Leucobacter sp. M11 TaxID=2993565 RepID=UPI002D7ED962
MIADLIVENARIRTVDDARPRASRLAVWRGQILGLDEDIAGLTARETLDAGGATVLPGLIDGHTHLGTTGLLSIALDVGGLPHRQAVLDRIAEAAADLAPDAWIDVVGYDQRALGGEHLTAAELDVAGGGRPVWAKHLSNHASVVSTAVLDAHPD